MLISIKCIKMSKYLCIIFFIVKNDKFIWLVYVVLVEYKN